MLCFQTDALDAMLMSLSGASTGRSFPHTSPGMATGCLANNITMSCYQTMATLQRYCNNFCVRSPQYSNQQNFYHYKWIRSFVWFDRPGEKKDSGSFMKQIRNLKALLVRAVVMEMNLNIAGYFRLKQVEQVFLVTRKDKVLITCNCIDIYTEIFFIDIGNE